MSYTCPHTPQHDTHAHLWDDDNNELPEPIDRFDCDPACAVPGASYPVANVE